MYTIKAVAKYSIIMAVIYHISFILVLSFNIIKDPNVIAITINLMTGFLTTASVSFVEFNVKLGESVKYFLEELISYYHSLYRLKRFLNSSAIINEKIEAIHNEFVLINKRAISKKQKLDIMFIFDSKKKKRFVEMLNNTYELTFGVELDYLELTYNSKKRKTIKIKEKYIELANKLIDAEFLQIYENLKNIKILKVYNNWLELKNNVVSIYEKENNITL